MQDNYKLADSHLATFLSDYPVLSSIALIALGAGLPIAFRTFIEKYVGARATSAAEDANLPRHLERSFAEQEAKALAARLDATKADGAMKILGLMAEIETTLFNWKLTAYFCLNQLADGETVEDLGRRDLSKVIQLLVVLIREANSQSILLGDDVVIDVMTWVNEVHRVAFDFEAAYRTSKQMHEGKPVDHTDRVCTVTDIMQREIYPTMDPIGQLKRQMRQKLSQKIECSVAELVR